MRKLAVLVLVLICAPALATEVLVLTTATSFKSVSTRERKGFEIQNLGPNDIWCELDATPVATKSRKVASSGGTWSASATYAQVLICLASTANQVTGAATVYLEVK